MMWVWGWARPAPQGRRGLGAKLRRSSPAETPVSTLRVPFLARSAEGTMSAWVIWPGSWRLAGAKSKGGRFMPVFQRQWLRGRALTES